MWTVFESLKPAVKMLSEMNRKSGTSYGDGDDHFEPSGHAFPRGELPIITIDLEFQSFIPPLTATERSHLESLLLGEGCREPLVVWAEEGILIDGHNRYEICQAHRIPFQVVGRSFPDREAVLRWMIANQLGRRNLPPRLASYLRGKHYQLSKKKVGGNGSNQYREQLGKNCPIASTAELLAAEYKVSPRTLKNDARFAYSVDGLGEVLGTEVRAEILGREARLSKKDTLELAKVAERAPEKAPEFFASLRAKPPRKRGKKQLTEGINYQPGLGCEYYVRLEAETWERLCQYQQQEGTVTLGGAIARLLDRVGCVAKST